MKPRMRRALCFRPSPHDISRLLEGSRAAPSRWRARYARASTPDRKHHVMNSSPPLIAASLAGDPLWVFSGRGPVPGPAEIGGKGYNLALLGRMAHAVPPFFVMRARALTHLLGGG